MRIKDGANYILMELGPRRETLIEYTVECPLRGFYSVGPVAVRIQDPFGLFHKEKELHVYNDFLVFPKMEDLKETFVKSRVPKIFTGAVNIRQPGPGSEFYSLREYFEGDSFRAINWSAYARSGKLMVNERERDAVSDIIIIVDSRSVAETGPCHETHSCIPLEQPHRLPSTSLVVVTALVLLCTVTKLSALTEILARSNSMSF